MKEAILEVIGAVVGTTGILGIPVLSFVSFTHNWPGFLIMYVLVGLAFAFLYVLSMLMGDTN